MPTAGTFVVTQKPLQYALSMKYVVASFIVRPAYCLSIDVFTKANCTRLSVVEISIVLVVIAVRCMRTVA